MPAAGPSCWEELCSSLGFPNGSDLFLLLQVALRWCCCAPQCSHSVMGEAVLPSLQELLSVLLTQQEVLNGSTSEQRAEPVCEEC